jgi:hypothetical protein
MRQALHGVVGLEDGVRRGFVGLEIGRYDTRLRFRTRAKPFPSGEAALSSFTVAAIRRADNPGTVFTIGPL